MSQGLMPPEVERPLMVGRVADLYDIDSTAADEALKAVKSPTAYLTMGAKRHRGLLGLVGAGLLGLGAGLGIFFGGRSRR